MRVIAISGKRCVGKDTFAALILGAATQHGARLASYAFAGESKRLFAAQHPEVDLERLLGERAYKEQWRPMLTAFTVAALARDPLVFCRAVVERMAAIGAPAVISDVRLQLELAHLRPCCDLRVIRIERNDAHRTTAGWAWQAGTDDHRTETELDSPTLWDERIANDGSLEALATHAAVSARWLCAVPHSDR